MDSWERPAAQERPETLELVDVAMARGDEVFEIMDSSEDAEKAEGRIRVLFRGAQRPWQPSSPEDSSCPGQRARVCEGSSAYAAR
ncbi:MAG: hypothetical protein ABI776_01605 [Nocardioidaceae bacterium]